MIPWPKIENEENWRIYFVWLNKLAFLTEGTHTFIFPQRATDSQSKREVLEICNINEKNVIA